MPRRLIVVIALVCLGALVVSVPASASSRDMRAKKKAACSLKKKATCKKAKFKNVKVGKQNLSGANLKGATITGGTFTGTNLSGVDLSNATITDVTFRNVNLTKANLSGARLEGVTFADIRAKGGRRFTGEGFDCLDVTTFALFDFAASCIGDGVDFSHMTAKKVWYSHAHLPGADFSYSAFHNVMFDSSIVTDANFYGTSWSNFLGLDFTSTSLGGSMFDASTGVYIDAGSAGVDWLYGTSFLGAKRVRFTRGLDAADRVRGRDGKAAVLVERGAGAPSYTSIRITGRWADSSFFYESRCAPAAKSAATTGNCVRALAVGDSVTAEVRSASNIALSGDSWFCTAAALETADYVSTCTGTLRADTTLTYAKAADITATSPVVTVDSVLQSGAATPMSKIRIETVAANGGRTIVQSCVVKTTCAATVAVGATVRVSVFREHSNGYFGMNCPGETGDAFTNMLTEWPTGDDTLSGDAGDTTRYALRRICPAFEVTSNVRLTAVNDSPDGAPSG